MNGGYGDGIWGWGWGRQRRDGNGGTNNGGGLASLGPMAVPRLARECGSALRTGKREMAEFTYRTMRVYQLALDLNGFAFEATRGVPTRSWPIEQQLIRAAASIVLNIAEGVTEYSPGEKTRFYRIALRSAGEAGAAFDVLVRHGVVSRAVADHANDQLQSIAAMVTNLILATEARRARTTSRSAPESPATRTTRTLPRPTTPPLPSPSPSPDPIPLPAP